MTAGRLGFPEALCPAPAFVGHHDLSKGSRGTLGGLASEQAPSTCDPLLASLPLS